MSNELTATVTKWTYSPIDERRVMLRHADLWDGNTYAALRWTELPEHIQRLITAADQAGNYLDYSCGCSYPTTEPSHSYDHKCAACFKALTGGKRW